MQSDDNWRIPALPFELGAVIGELRGLARGGLQQQHEGEEEEVKGLKFISGKLARLFDRSKRMNYNHISRVLIDNFSSQSNDSRNIKRRVYDAINVMVAAGVFQKSGDSLEKKEGEGYRERVDELKSQLNSDYLKKQGILAVRRKMLGQLLKRKKKLQELLQRNKQVKGKKKIENPVFVRLSDSAESLRVMTKSGDLCWADMKKSGRKKGKGGKQSQIFENYEYLEYL